MHLRETLIVAVKAIVIVWKHIIKAICGIISLHENCMKTFQFIEDIGNRVILLLTSEIKW